MTRQTLTKEKVEKQLEQSADYWIKKGVLIETKLLYGKTSREIVMAAETLHCNLIAMGMPNKNKMQHYLKGTVTERIIRTSPLPVVTVKVDMETTTRLKQIMGCQLEGSFDGRWHKAVGI